MKTYCRDRACRYLDPPVRRSARAGSSSGPSSVGASRSPPCGVRLGDQSRRAYRIAFLPFPVPFDPKPRCGPRHRERSHPRAPMPHLAAAFDKISRTPSPTPSPLATRWNSDPSTQRLRRGKTDSSAPIRPVPWIATPWPFLRAGCRASKVTCLISPPGECTFPVHIPSIAPPIPALLKTPGIVP